MQNNIHVTALPSRQAKKFEKSENNFSTSLVWFHATVGFWSILKNSFADAKYAKIKVCWRL